MVTGESMEVCLLIDSGLLLLYISFFFFLLILIQDFTALKSSRLLEGMASRGIKYVDCYGVDNVMVSFLAQS